MSTSTKLWKVASALARATHEAARYHYPKTSRLIDQVPCPGTVLQTVARNLPVTTELLIQKVLLRPESPVYHSVDSAAAVADSPYNEQAASSAPISDDFLTRVIVQPEAPVYHSPSTDSITKTGSESPFEVAERGEGYVDEKVEVAKEVANTQKQEEATENLSKTAVVGQKEKEELHTPSKEDTTTPSFADSSSSRSLLPPNNKDENETSSPPLPTTPVPSTRVGRALGFASLGLNLLYGTVQARLSGGGTSNDNTATTALLSSSNATTLAQSLARLRGAALKLGQLLSIQQLPPVLADALQQVRNGAHAVPPQQVEQQMETAFGENWNQRLFQNTFDIQPVAAASLGQVHKAVIRDSHDRPKKVAVKIQYPGVANSIDSDLKNLILLVRTLFISAEPKGLFLDRIVEVASKELKDECDYEREAVYQERFSTLVAADPILSKNGFSVPAVVPSHSSCRVLTMEWVTGGTIDACLHLTSQAERNRLAYCVLYLVFTEVFRWHMMQTDPQWGNFLYDTHTKQATLIDFGATLEYDKRSFCDSYLRLVWASANGDTETILQQSKLLGFLTGEENDEMLSAHIESGLIVAEPFSTNEPYTFTNSTLSTRLRNSFRTVLLHRLSPPPEEVYTLHRKISGAYLLCVKLEATISCREILASIVREYNFEDGLPRPHVEDNRW